MYTWSCTSLLVQWCYYGRRHPWLRHKEFRKYGSIRTKMYKKTFVNAVSYIHAVCCGMTCPMSWKNPVHLMYLKATIVSSLVDNLWIYMGKFIYRCTLFNPLHIPGFFLPTFRVLYKRLSVSYFRIIYQIFYGMTFMLCWYVICLFILCGIILCFRQGSKVEQFHWLVLPCINIFEKKFSHILQGYVTGKADNRTIAPVPRK